MKQPVSSARSMAEPCVVAYRDETQTSRSLLDMIIEQRTVLLLERAGCVEAGIYSPPALAMEVSVPRAKTSSSTRLDPGHYAELFRIHNDHMDDSQGKGESCR